METYFLRSGKMKSGRSPIEEIQLSRLMITSYLFKRQPKTLYKNVPIKILETRVHYQTINLFLPFLGLKVT